jgi:WD40 repeat protein
MNALTLRHAHTVPAILANAVYRMIRRRALAAGIFAPVCCHSFRATGIIVYLENNGTRLRGHEGIVTAVGFSPDNRWVVTGSFDNTARLWDLSAKEPAASPVVLRGHQDTVTAVGFSPDNHWVVTVSDDKTARLWPLQLKDFVHSAVRLV